MILKIDYKPEDVILNKNGRLLLRLRYYSAFATACHISTTYGTTEEDFRKNPDCKSSNIFVGKRGGISLK